MKRYRFGYYVRIDQEGVDVGDANNRLLERLSDVLPEALVLKYLHVEEVPREQPKAIVRILDDQPL